ncbi:MAG TPA: helicase, partial [Hyphomicrobiaceae bacterium]|nr:helicase [Hyphomicrobiaceae bacterium]
VERHYVGRLQGFRFYADTQAEGIHGKAARNAAAHVLAKELGMRVRRVVAAKNEAFKLSRQGAVLWRDEEIARLEAGDDALKPTVTILADDHLAAADKEKVRDRLTAWLGELCTERLKPLLEITGAQDIAGLARGIAFRLKEDFGVLRRESVSEEIRLLDQPARAQLRKYGVRFGAFNIFFPVLLKPASTDLARVLWTLKHGPAHGLDVANLPEPPRAGLTSLAADPGIPEAFYRVGGYHLCGPRAVRIDMLERLSDLIRPLVAWRSDPANPAPPPKGATGDGGFRTTPEMMSILGCSAAELGNVLKVLGFRLDRRRLAPAQPHEAASGADPAAAATESATAPLAGTQVVGVTEGDVGTPSEPLPLAIAVPESGSAIVAPASPEDAAEELWEEFWRPRRRGREMEERPQRSKPMRRRPSEHTPPKPAAHETRKDRPDQHKPRRDPRNKERYDKRPRAQLEAAPPGSKTGGFDPNSPFAALYSLKAAMDKRSQD